MVNQDVSHQLCRQAEELRAALPVHILLLHQFHIGFINKRSWLECVVITFSAKIDVGQLVELVIDQGHQIVERFPIAAAPSDQQLGYSGRRSHHYYSRHCQNASKIDEAQIEEWPQSIRKTNLYQLIQNA